MSQIKAAEIVDSDQYRTGCTLRFPRVEKIRDDRAWHSCMTTVDIDDLRQKSSGKLAGQYADGEAGEDEPKRKRTKAASTVVKPTVDSRFRRIDSSAVEKISDAFASKEFCVVSGCSALSKTDAERRLVELGATVVQNPSESTYCVVADKTNLRLRNIVSAKVYDVVRMDWLVRCIEEKRLIPWTPTDMIHCAPRTISSFSGDYDRHGDSYYDRVTVDELKTIFDRMPKDEICAAKNETSIIAELEMKYYPHDSARGLFRLCCVYLDSCAAIGDPTTRFTGSRLDLVGLELRFAGATLARAVTDDVSHVVVDLTDLSRVELFKYYNRSREGKRFHIVTAQWIYDCIVAGKLLQERSYEPD